MDAQTVSKEALTDSLRKAICHVNRNIYEWRHDKKEKSVFVLSYTEVKGLVRNWLIRALRDKIGHADADRLCKGVYISMDDQAFCVKSISLSWDARSHPLHATVDSILRDMNYRSLKYDPADYVTDGLSDKKPGVFDPFFHFSLEEIRNIKF